MFCLKSGIKKFVIGPIYSATLARLSTDFIGTALFVTVFFTQKLIWKEEWKGLLGLQLSKKDLVNAFQGR